VRWKTDCALVESCLSSVMSDGGSAYFSDETKTKSVVWDVKPNTLAHSLEIKA